MVNQGQGTNPASPPTAKAQETPKRYRCQNGRSHMLLITDPEVRQVLNMRDCIEAMERAFTEEALGIAVNKPRTRYKVPPDLDKPGYMANIIPGAVPSSGVAALRYDSTIVQERIVAG